MTGETVLPKLQIILGPILPKIAKTLNLFSMECPSRKTQKDNYIFSLLFSTV